jgi:glycosyltransferase involved in cell wall biosynthesis
LHHRDKHINFAAKIKKKSLRIAVNTRLLLKGKLEGIGWVSFENLKRITQAHPEHEFFFLFDRPYSEEFIFSDNVKPIVVSPPARHPVLYLIWFEMRIPAVLKKIKADLFFSPDSYLSLRTGVKSITIFHDLNFIHRPKDVPFWARQYYQYFFPRFARKANKIIAVSEFTKQDIIRQYGVPHSKIEVIYNGSNEQFAPLAKAGQEKIREQYTAGNPFFVFVGAFNPRKNLSNLFRAFDMYKQKMNDNMKLIVIGEKMYWTRAIEDAYNLMQFKDDVIFTGRLPMSLLTQVIASSVAMTYVSFLEGFGIPIIEGFRAGVPVITSNVTSMPEVAGDAAYLVNPHDCKDISNAMIRVSQEPELRQSLIDKGNIRKNKFSWDHSAQQIWNLIARELNITTE